MFAKPDAVFGEDSNISKLLAYGNSSNPKMRKLTSYDFSHLVSELENHNIILFEPVLAFRSQKNAIISRENERLVAVTELILDSKPMQLKD